MPKVSTTHGTLFGETIDGVAAFKGIPYAAPPFGPNRFLPPQPIEPWDGVRDAREYGPTAPKGPYPAPISRLLPEPDIPGDDCLNLNVWTPDPAARLPVMVWVHGGAFTNGSGAAPSYDGSRFARDGVVCVTINYRLGVDGFLYFDDGGPANLGLRDQVAALRWVRDNIAAFGGDAANVTVFGESAGAMSIGALLGSPEAAGLFHRAILQSGAAHHVLTAPTARRIGRHLTTMLGIPATREAVAAIPLDRLVQTVQELRTAISADPDPARWGEVAHNLMPLEPVVDGDFLPGPPIESIASAACAAVDILVGSNSEEFRFFLVPTGLIDLVDDAALRTTAAGYGLDPDRALATYSAEHPDASPGDLRAAVATDWFYRLPAIRLAEARKGGPGATYLYEFAWRPPTFEGRLGAGHTLEIPFVFDRLDDPAFAPQLGAEPPQELAEAMHAAWISFASEGNPGWPGYDTHHRTTMRFDTSPEILADPAPGRRMVWDGIR
jgi:para-nitrobenzyl esterase